MMSRATCDARRLSRHGGPCRRATYPLTQSYADGAGPARDESARLDGDGGRGNEETSIVLGAEEPVGSAAGDLANRRPRHLGLRQSHVEMQPALIEGKQEVPSQERFDGFPGSVPQ